MDFQIHALPAEDFNALFDLSDVELAQRNARREVVRTCPGTPCRVSMADAEVGETVILTNYTHQPENSPYRATHAIFVRQGFSQAAIGVNEVPLVIRSRLISVRKFNAKHMMIDADVVQGTEVGIALRDAFDQTAVAYVHLHNAKPGCFAAKVTRANKSNA